MSTLFAVVRDLFAIIGLLFTAAFVYGVLMGEARRRRWRQRLQIRDSWKDQS